MSSDISRWSQDSEIVQTTSSFCDKCLDITQYVDDQPCIKVWTVNKCTIRNDVWVWWQRTKSISIGKKNYSSLMNNYIFTFANVHLTFVI